ncbi:MAG: hypothetical protein H6679_05385 [Epsilonproteobacteria bacterium]|nr:hypothetical protein [Campylobacterota bacterium]
MYKKVLSCALSCATLLTLCPHKSLQAYPIYSSYLETQINKYANDYLRQEGVDSQTIPSKLRWEYESNLEKASNRLRECISTSYFGSVDDAKVRQVVKEELASFARTMHSIIKAEALDIKVTEQVHNELFSQGLTPDDIPSELVSEYLQIGHKVMVKLRNTMREDQRTYVRINEIEKTVRDEFASFISYVKSLHTGHGNFSSHFSFWNWIFGPAIAQPTAPSYVSSQSDRVKRFELEARTKEAAERVMRLNCLDPTSLSNRVSPDYQRKLDVIRTRMRNDMSINNRDYVYLEDLERTARQELQSVIDKATFKNETCSICLEGYTPGERVGILNCSSAHAYHKDCIYPWLERDTSCPLCRKTNVIVAKQETVP